jgi:hypothetical protein
MFVHWPNHGTSPGRQSLILSADTWLVRAVLGLLQNGVLVWPAAANLAVRSATGDV